MRFSSRHEFVCPQALILSDQVYFHPDFHRQLYGELGFASWEVLEHTRSGDRLREVRLKRPRRELPATVRRALGVQQIEYREELDYDLAAHSYSVRVIPNMLPGKLLIGGTVRIDALGPERCVRSVDIDVQVRIFAIGGVVERHVVDDIRTSYAKADRFMERWLREHVAR